MGQGPASCVHLLDEHHLPRHQVMPAVTAAASSTSSRAALARSARSASARTPSDRSGATRSASSVLGSPSSIRHGSRLALPRGRLARVPARRAPPRASGRAVGPTEPGRESRRLREVDGRGVEATTHAPRSRPRSRWRLQPRIAGRVEGQALGQQPFGLVPPAEPKQREAVVLRSREPSRRARPARSATSIPSRPIFAASSYRSARRA